MYDSKLIKKKLEKEKRKKSEDVDFSLYRKRLINRILLTIFLVLVTLISVKMNPSLKSIIRKRVYEDNISFSKINELYQKYLGGVIPFDFNIELDNKDNLAVFNEKLEYQKIEDYKDGAKLTVSKNYLVPAMDSGIIVFIGEKEGYSKVIIVQQVNGVDLWYGNVTDTSYKLYDYVEKGDLLGSTIDDKMYLVYQKSGEFLDYKEYLS